MAGVTRLGTLTLAASLLLTWEGLAIAGPGDVDPSFGKGGRVDVEDPVVTRPRALVVQPDGKILMAGDVYGYDVDKVAEVGRFRPGGSLDTSFGDGGWTRLEFGEEGASRVASMVLQDEKIIVAGAFGDLYYDPDSADAVIARLLPNGNLDVSFGDGGVLRIDAGSYEEAVDVGLLPGGNLVTVMTGDRRTRVLVARVRPDGELDPTYGDGGIRPLPLPGSNVPTALQVDPHGGVVITGTNFPNSGSEKSRFFVTRLRWDGTLVRDFGGDGTVTTSFRGDDVWATDVALQRNGKVVVAGSSSSGMSFARYLPNGSPDTRFGGDGKSVVAFGNRSPAGTAERVIAADDGSLTAGGCSGRALALARLRANGSLDRGFGQEGRVVTRLGYSSECLVDLAIQRRGWMIGLARRGNCCGQDRGATLLRYEV